MQVLKTTVKLRPGLNPFSAKGWWSGWVTSRNGVIIQTSPASKHWQGRKVEEFMHWALCTGGPGCYKSEFTDAGS